MIYFASTCRLIDPQPRTLRGFLMFSKLYALLAGLLLIVAWGCAAGGKGSPPPPDVSITISPLSANLSIGDSRQFTATVQNASNTTVTWLVNGLPGGSNSTGTISAAGLYAATAAGTFMVTARSVADPTKSADANVTVTSAVSVTISPTSANLMVGGTQQFTATVQNASNTTVTWLVNGVPGGSNSTGTISASGLYTATASGTFTVTARSVADPTKSANATVAVAAPGSVTITVDTTQAGQTWRAWRATVGTGVKREDSTPQCLVLSDSVLNSINDDLVNDFGMNGLRLEQKFAQGLEASANDNADPFVLNMSAFTPGLEATWPKDPCGNLPKVDIVPKFVTPFRTMVLARGDPFDLYISFGGYTYASMPSWWQSNVEEGAEAVQAYWTWFSSNWGFYPDWLTFNEPDSGFFGSPSWMGGFTKAIGNRFQSMGVTSKIEQPSAVTPGEAVWMLDTITNTSGASPFVGRVTFHGYDYNAARWPSAGAITSRNNLRTRAKTLGVETGMTEICCKGWDGSYSSGLDLVRDMYVNMVEADISVWEPFGYLVACRTAGCVVGSSLSFGGGDLIHMEPNLSTYYLQPDYWVRRQFTRYIRPGYVRVSATCTGCTSTSIGPDVKAVAWKRSDGSVVVNIINDSGASKSITISGIPAANYDLHKLDPTMCVTSGGKNRCTPQLQVLAAGPSLSLTIPTNGVWTVSQQ